MAFLGFLVDGEFHKEPPQDRLIKLKQVILDEFELEEQQQPELKPEEPPAA